MKMNVKTLFGFAAVAGLLVVAAPVERAQALPLTPGVASSAGQAIEGAVTEVRWRRHHRWQRHHGWRHRHHRHWR